MKNTFQSKVLPHGKRAFAQERHRDYGTRSLELRSSASTDILKDIKKHTFLNWLSDSCPDVIKQVLQNDLTNVEKWLVSNRLILNQSKTKWMLFGTRQKLEHCPDYKIELHGKNIDRVSSFCYLGVKH